MAKKNNSEQLTKQVLTAYPELKSSGKARQLVRMVSQQISIKSGPYPSPEDYEHYHEIDPSLTTLMKEMVVKEQEHQHKMDEKYLDKDFLLRKSGQWFAFLVFVLVIGLGGYSIFIGQVWVGALISSTGVVGIIAQFLKRR